MENNAKEGWDYLWEQVWWSYLESEYTVRYWERLSSKCHRIDFWARFILAIATGGTFAGLWFWKYAPCIWKGVSLITFLLAATHTFMNWQKSESDASKLYAGHRMISLRYKNVMLHMKTGVSLDKVMAEYEQIEGDEAAIETPSKFRKYKDKLQLECQDAIEIEIESRRKKNG